MLDAWSGIDGETALFGTWAEVGRWTWKPLVFAVTWLKEDDVYATDTSELAPGAGQLECVAI